MALKEIAVAVFGRVADSQIGAFGGLKKHLQKANLKYLPRAWISMMYFFSLVAFIVALAEIIFLNTLFGLGELFIVYLFAVPILAACAVFSGMYLYPIQKWRAREKSIENNLPFAVTQMAAITSAGIPPEFMFNLLTEYKEYGEISKEAKTIVTNINTFGLSSVSAIKKAAARTPSSQFREILLGMVSTIEKGGDLFRYLQEMSDKTLFEYKIKREKYLKMLSTYADIYTALLVAAPLMMLATLGIMNIIGGQVLGIGIPLLVNIITFLILPLINAAFLIFLHLTHPGG